MLSVLYAVTYAGYIEPFMQSFIMMNVVMLSVIEPILPGPIQWNNNGL